MPSILERLRAEREAQAAEEARPPFTSVDEVRAYIERAKPEAKENVSLEMCVLAIDEEDKRWCLGLIDRELETEFDAVAKAYKELDVSRRNQYIFHLSLWKNYHSEVNVVDFRVGFSYRFEKVHSLRVGYGRSAGSVQIRQRLRAVPLPPQGSAAATAAPHDAAPILNVEVPNSASSLPADTGDAPQAGGAPATADGADDTVGGPAVKSSSKRKARKSDGNKEPSFESPTKKSRATLGA